MINSNICSNCHTYHKDVKENPTKELGFKMLCPECMNFYNKKDYNGLGDKAFYGWMRYIKEFDNKHGIK